MNLEMPSLSEDILAVKNGVLPYRVFRIGEIRSDGWFTIRLTSEWYIKPKTNLERWL